MKGYLPGALLLIIAVAVFFLLSGDSELGAESVFVIFIPALALWAGIIWIIYAYIKSKGRHYQLAELGIPTDIVFKSMDFEFRSLNRKGNVDYHFSYFSFANDGFYFVQTVIAARSLEEKVTFRRKFDYAAIEKIRIVANSISKDAQIILKDGHVSDPNYNPEASVFMTDRENPFKKINPIPDLEMAADSYGIPIERLKGSNQSLKIFWLGLGTIIVVIALIIIFSS